MLSELSWFLVGAGAVGVIGAVTWWLWHKQAASSNSSEQIIALLGQQISEHLNHVTDQLNTRLQENVQAMNESKSFLAARVSTAEQTMHQVHSSLGRLEQATTALHQTNTEIAQFQQMLRHPKIRGSVGEVLLSHLLANVLPQERFELQYNFPGSSEIADAIIRLQDGYIVAIDAKFPLSHYQDYMQQKDPALKRAARQQFLKSVKNHVVSIASKYIMPRHKTLDYAFMYIPVESIYYESIVHDEAGEHVWEFALQHKVVPVSPNSFLAYLHTILIGLRGFKIEQQAQEILRRLSQLRQDIKIFSKDFVMVGTHLSNARNRYDDSARRLDKLSDRLGQIETNNDAVLPEQSPE